MSSNNIDQSIQCVEAFDQARILCVGDVMLDRFVYGEVSRISPEAPIPVMKREREISMLGGAGNVLRNVVSLGAHCHFISVIGSDMVGDAIRELMKQTERCEAKLIEQAERRSSEKVRFVCGVQQLLRCDNEDREPISAASEEALLAAIKATLEHYQLLILSDYAKGVLTERVIRETIALAKAANVAVFIDPKRDDMSLYAGADLLSPNLKEMQAFAAQDDPLEAVARLRKQHAIGAIALTRGKEGLSLFSDAPEPFHAAAQARAVYDVSGAGDTVIACLAVAFAAGASLEHAAELANVAAGIAVSRPGTATVYRTDLKAALHHRSLHQSASKLVSADMAAAMVRHWQEEGHKVGFTNGCFDLLHVGHLDSLKSAKSHCDKLVVAINSDASVKRLKGDSRPLNAEMDRADLLGGLAPVDLVVIFREDTPEAVLHQLRPDVLMKGEDYAIEQVVGGDFVRSYGGEVKLLALKEGYSSTGLITKSQSS